MTSSSARVLSETLGKLKIDETAQRRTTPKLADSWEDEAAQEPASPKGVRLESPEAEFPGAPPTSPASPSVRTKATSSGSPFQTFPPFGMNGSLEADRPTATASRDTDSGKRPEKTTATAARLIAAGIGQKPARRTQDEKEYDKAMRIQEKKRRDAAKEELARIEREKEKAKLSIWED